MITARHVLEQMSNDTIRAEMRGLQRPFSICFPNQERFTDADGDNSIRMERLELADWRNFVKPDVSVAEVVSVRGNTVTPLTLATASVEEGDRVVLCGFPHSSRLQMPRTLNALSSAGIVGATLPFGGLKAEYRDGIMVHAFAHAGSSGGPVIDLASGQVVGLVRRCRMEEVVGADSASRTVALRYAYAEDLAAIRRVVDIFLDGPIPED